LSLVLADTSVWVAHFRKPNRVLQSLLADDQILCHPLIVIEIACGTPPAPRERTLADLGRLRSSIIASTDETLALIEAEQLDNSGCGAIDMSLLASVLLTPEATLWTIDKNLGALARRLKVASNGAGR
jgi:predicted nucleic acid-binding protein